LTAYQTRQARNTTLVQHQQDETLTLPARRPLTVSGTPSKPSAVESQHGTGSRPVAGTASDLKASTSPTRVTDNEKQVRVKGWSTL
jgi:hypothetical protein